MEVVKGFLDRAAANDLAGIRGFLDPEVVWYGTRGGLDQDQVLRGADAHVEYMREIQDAWERFDVEVERLMEVGDAVVVFLRETGKVRQGEVELHNETAAIFRVRRQKIVEVTGYLDRDEALRDAARRRD